MPWSEKDLSSGLLDDYTGTVDRSYFASDERYTDDAGTPIPQLYWEIGGIEAEEDVTRDEFTEKFSLGGAADDWAIVDDGAKVENVAGKKLGKGSRYGMIVSSVITGKPYDLTAVGDEVANRGTIYDAAVWEGLRFRFQRVKKNYGGDIGERSFVLPVEYLGVDDGKGRVSAPSPSSSTATAGGSTSNGGDAKAERVKLEAKLRELAREADNPVAFIDLALEQTNVADHDDLLAKVADDGKDGYFAQVRQGAEQSV